MFVPHELLSAKTTFPLFVAVSPSLFQRQQPPLSFSILHRAQLYFEGFAPLEEERRRYARARDPATLLFFGYLNGIAARTLSFTILTKIVTSRFMHRYVRTCTLYVYADPIRSVLRYFPRSVETLWSFNVTTRIAINCS